MRKRKIKSMLWAGGVIFVVLLLVIAPFLMELRSDTGGDSASILSARVERSTIETSFSGVGTLVDQDAVRVGVPDGVRLTELLVENGQQVEIGTPLAKVDTVSVMEAVTKVQDTLDSLKEQLEATSDQEAETMIRAQVGGRVMAVYCEAGDDVQQVMLAHGALAVISLDGKLAVSFDTDASVSTGDEVVVTLRDGTEVDGRVESALMGTVSVTISDDLAALDDSVSVTSKTGTVLGSGSLRVHSAWNASAYTGKIRDVSIAVGDKISDGKTIFTLENAEDRSEFDVLSAKHRVYEEILTELFTLYQEKTIYAKTAGFVTLPDDTDAFLLAAAEESYQLAFLANAPTGDDLTQYINFVGRVSQGEDQQLVLEMNPMPVAIEDYLNYSPRMNGMTEQRPLAFPPTTPVFWSEEGEWKQGNAENIIVGDILIFAYTMESPEPVWIVRYSVTSEQPTPADPSTPIPNLPNTEPSGPNPSGGATYPNLPNMPSYPNLPSNFENYFSGMQSGAMYNQYAQSGLYAQFGGTPMEEEVVSLYSDAETEVMTLTPCEEMYLDITVDELDVLLAELGQRAQVTVDALPGRAFEGEITKISTNGSNLGGNSKYIVTVRLSREADMLGGMNASAVIPLREHKNLLSIPVAALVDQGAKTYVYTEYTEDNGLNGLTEVETGLSDGETVEIRTGLAENDEIWYAYYDHVPISNEVDQGPQGYFH